MTNRYFTEQKSQESIRRRLSAALINEAKIKEHEAACWLGLPNNIEESRAAVHSSLDAVLDATQNQIEVALDQFRTKSA